MFYFLYTILFLIFSSCQFDAGNKERINTTQQIDTASNTVFQIDETIKKDSKINLNFYYHDALAYGNQLIITKKGIKLAYNRSTFFFEASSKQTPFLIYPNEKINLKYADTDSVLFYVTGNKIRSNELNFFRKLVQANGNVYYAFSSMPYLKKSETLSNFYISEKKINEQKIKRLNFLEKYNTKTPISETFNIIAKNSISCIALQDSLILLNNNKELLIQKGLFKKILNAKLVSIKEIEFLPYQFNYNAYSSLISLITVNTLNTEIDEQKIFVKKFDFIEKNTSGKAREFLLSNIINMATLGIVKVSDDYIKKFKLLCLSDQYEQLVLSILEKNNTNSYKTDNVLQANNDGLKNLNDVLSLYRGKLILIDFWASWCAPCRVEMPYTKLLKNEYKNKNIVFIYISTDRKKDSWLIASNVEKLEVLNSYLLLDPDNSPFVKKYNLLSIPRYMLLGKDGYVINDNAPRPSDIKLKNLIDMNL
jgi:thiol-disulfide isomerase/thioredoxin